MDDVLMYLAVLVALLICLFVPRMWWMNECPACDHEWRRMPGRAGSSSQYACSRCDRTLRRRDDAWPPLCRVGDREGDCGWPHCQPIGGPRNLPRRYLESVRRFLWNFWDAPE
jgi:hypothetical protein